MVSGSRWPSFAQPAVNTVPNDDGDACVLESLPLLEVPVETSSRSGDDAMLKHANVIRLEGRWVRTQLLQFPPGKGATASSTSVCQTGEGALAGNPPPAPGVAPAAGNAEAELPDQDCQKILVFACTPSLRGLKDLMVSLCRPRSHGVSCGNTSRINGSAGLNLPPYLLNVASLL